MLVATGTITAHAAKYTKINIQNEPLVYLQQSYDDALSFCTKYSDTDCGVEAYQIISKKDDESLVNTVKQMIHANGYVDEVSGEFISKKGNALFEAYKDVLAARGFLDGSDRDIILKDFDLVKINLIRDIIKNKNVVVTAGNIKGEFSADYNYIAFIDLKNKQVMIFSAGYSE